METKFTKGPWFVTKSGSSYYVESKMNGAMIQEVAWCGRTFYDEQEENARLMSAAPDLLEAVETLLDCFVNDPLGWMDSSDIAIEKAYDAIHKAKGE
jgi:hypothetical protein